MTALHLCESLLLQSLSTTTERAARWSNASYRVAQVLPEHFILVADIQQVGRLDCVVSALEGDIARLLLASAPQTPTFSVDFSIVLAKSWLSLTYEVVRTIKQRILSKSELRARWGAGLNQAFLNLERVRMAELKREIAKGSKLKGRVEMFVQGHEQATTKEYLHGQSVVNSPIALRPTDGSIVWVASNPELGSSEELYRRDMSEHLIRELEKL